MHRIKTHLGRGFLAAFIITFCIGALVFFSGVSVASTPAGTNIDNIVSINFNYGGNPYIRSSNQTTVTVNSLVGFTIDSHIDGYIQPSLSKSYSHTVTNTGNSVDTIDLTLVSSLGFTVELFEADGVTALTDSDADTVVDTGPLASGATFDIVVKVTAPANAVEGQVDETTLTGTSTNDLAVIVTIVHTTTVLRARFWDPLVKTVDPPGQVTQNSILTYTNTFGNAGNIPATNIVITDMLDANLIYIAGSATEPPGITGTIIVYDAFAHSVTWTIPSIPAGYEGQISFQSRIDPAMPSDSSISNTISYVSDQTPVAQVSNVAASTIVEQPLRITKSANKDVAEIGDYAIYTVGVENKSATMTVTNVKIQDSLPKGFRYLKRSSMLDSVVVTDPTGGTDLEWSIGTLTPGASRTLTYRVIVSIDAPLGNGVNSATVVGKSPGINDLTAGPVTATVKVKEGVLNSKTIILGRIFIDENGDKMPGADEPGMGGVRVYLEDGTYADTDSQGKFSIYGVRAGEHILKLDPGTIPKGFTTVPLDNSFAGDGGSRFITAPFGGPARGDFALSRNGNAEESSASKKEKTVVKRKKYTFGTAVNSKPVPLEKRIKTMPTTAEILEPADGEQLKKNWGAITIRVPEGSEYVLKVNGVAVPVKNIGKTLYESRRKIFIHQYVGVTFEAGRNVIVLKIVTPEEEREVSAVTIVVPGAPARLKVVPDKVDMPADGKTTVPFTVEVLDRWGAPNFDELVLTVLSEKGMVVGEDLDPSAPGHQVKTKDGKASFRLRAGNKTGKDKFKVLLGSKVEQKADVYFTPGLREWIVVGLGEVTAGHRDVSGNIEKITEDDGFETGIFHEERLAFFAKGKILGKYLLTATYDNKKEKSDDLFSTVEPDRYYPIYGDSSEIGYEGESSRNYYVKMEKDRSYVMFGDYHTELSSTELTRYNRTFNGIKVEMEKGRYAFKGFASSTSQTITKDELRANGTSGYYFLEKKPVILNSETIRIETRDRYHPEIVLSSAEKARYTDYSINYISGAILFSEPVASTDKDLNPTYIVVSYESDDPGDKYYIYGGRGAVKSKNGSELGFTTVIEENDLKDTTLLGVDGKVKIGKKTELRAEAAMSDTLASGKDNAWKVEVTTKPKEGLTVDLHYRDVGSEFDNPSMSGSEAGTKKYGVKADYKAGKSTDIIVESFVQNNMISRTKLKSSSVGVVRKIKRSTVETGYRVLREENRDEDVKDKSSQVGYVKVKSTLTDKLSANVGREQVISSTEVEDYQTKSSVGVGYKITENIDANLSHEIQEGKDTRIDSTRLGLTNRITDNTTLFSRYQIENVAAGRNIQASTGFNNKWQPKEGLTFNTTAERSQTIKGENELGDNTAFTVATEYLPRKDLKVTGRYELRLAEDETANLFNVGTVFKFNESLSFIGKLKLWRSEKVTGTDTLFDGLTGLAYRPLGNRSIYLLNTIRYKVDRQGSSALGGKEQNLIFSSESTYRVTPLWTLTGKYAGKYSRQDIGSKSFRSYTDLVIVGASYDINNKLDLGVYAKLMNQYQTKMHSLGALLKVSYRVYKNTRIGVGYNLSRMEDHDLEGEDYQSRGVFVDLRFKFDESTLFRKNKSKGRKNK